MFLQYLLWMYFLLSSDRSPLYLDIKPLSSTKYLVLLKMLLDYWNLRKSLKSTLQILPLIHLGWLWCNIGGVILGLMCKYHYFNTIYQIKEVVVVIFNIWLDLLGRTKRFLKDIYENLNVDVWSIFCCYVFILLNWMTWTCHLTYMN